MIRKAVFTTFALFAAAAGVLAQDAGGAAQEKSVQGETVRNDADEPPQRNEDARDRVLFADETERIVPIAKKLTRNILMDQKDIWTSPLHMSRADAASWLVIGGVTGGLIASDHWTARQLPNTVDQVTISKDVSQLGAVYTILPATAGLYIGGALFHNPKARETGILGGEAILDSMVVVGAFKVVFRRPRPLESSGSAEFFTGGASFPSGHSAASFALASVVAHEYNQNIVYPIAAYGLATLVSFSRLSGQQHFPSDIVAGGAIGWYIGRYVFKTHVDHAIHMRPPSKLASLRPQIIPHFDAATGTRAVVLTWPLGQ
jgi:membrane-associated phospholipid phosphatase